MLKTVAPRVAAVALSGALLLGTAPSGSADGQPPPSNELGCPVGIRTQAISDFAGGRSRVDGPAVSPRPTFRRYLARERRKGGVLAAYPASSFERLRSGESADRPARQAVFLHRLPDGTVDVRVRLAGGPDRWRFTGMVACRHVVDASR